MNETTMLRFLTDLIAGLFSPRTPAPSRRVDWRGRPLGEATEGHLASACSDDEAPGTLLPPVRPARSPARRPACASQRKRERKPVTAGGQPSRRGRPRVEALEDRLALTVTAELVDGTLTVTGDEFNNVVSLFESLGQIHVEGAVAPNAFPTRDVFHIDIKAGGGSDTINLSSSLRGNLISLKANGEGSDGDTLRAHEPSTTRFAKNYTVTSNTIVRTDATTIEYEGFERLRLDATGDSTGHVNLDNEIVVESLTVPLTINAFVGNDTLKLCPGGRFLDAIGIQARIVFNGGSGLDTLLVYDENNGFDDTFDISTGGVDRPLFGGVEASDYDAAVFYTGWGNNTYVVTTAPDAHVRIEDAGGVDTLDYSTWHPGVTIDLPRGTATGLADGISGIENALGGHGVDRMSGDLGTNIFVGNGGNDILMGGGGRDLLIGGNGADTINGGSGQDLIIGGRTAFDSDVAALNAIMAEWSSSRAYSQRIQDLTNVSNPTFLLPNYGSRNAGKAATVFDDGVADTLSGGEPRLASVTDWFFGFPSEVTDRGLGEQVH